MSFEANFAAAEALILGAPIDLLSLKSIRWNMGHKIYLLVSRNCFSTEANIARVGTRD
ncbi:hypothetical protein H072_2485 [Dactylellina haptotyla CBS 200.50]|uniref:Uncharacterized protein n=1 Tax=Dactylellina haptotyla (strain CBS 200.50) TaxID=1284197 RepID=S8AKU5_DACHA|nr:hypothetical protein H072_2485 [Dactylellina haptotyla CBS 200.50]